MIYTRDSASGAIFRSICVAYQRYIILLGAKGANDVMQSAQPAAPTTTAVPIVDKTRAHMKTQFCDQIVRTHNYRANRMQGGDCKWLHAPVALFPPRNRTDLSHQHVFVGAYSSLLFQSSCYYCIWIIYAHRRCMPTCVFHAKCNLEYSLHGNRNLSRDQMCFTVTDFTSRPGTYTTFPILYGTGK